MPIFKNPNFDFLKWLWPAVGLSLLIIVAGAFAAAKGGLALGIDFSGGTSMIVQFDDPVTEDIVRDAIGGIADENVVQRYGPADANEILIRLPQSGPEEGARLEVHDLPGLISALVCVGAGARRLDEADVDHVLLQDLADGGQERGHVCG